MMPYLLDDSYDVSQSHVMFGIKYVVQKADVQYL